MIASEKMSALGQFTSGIAHEVSNPPDGHLWQSTRPRATCSSRRILISTRPKPRWRRICEVMAARIEKIVKAVRFFSRAPPTTTRFAPFRSK